MKNKITIITPVFNGEKYIERCILSVLNQTYKNIEHIIVNDGSSDKTKEICEKYKNKITLINKENGGVSKARNEALNLINSDFVLFVDADDWLEKTMCEKLVTKALNSKSDIVVCGYNNYYENTQKIEKVILKDDKNSNFLELITDAKSNFGGFPWNKLIKSSIITKKYDDSIHYYENLLFFLENCNEKTSYSIVNECLYNYCINATSAVHSKKYNIKKLTSLDALINVIKLLPEKSVQSHKIAFINSYYNNLYQIQTNYKNNILDIKKYDDVLNDYYIDIMKDTKVKLIVKIKIFFMKNIYFAYYLFKKAKEKLHE